MITSRLYVNGIYVDCVITDEQVSGIVEELGKDAEFIVIYREWVEGHRDKLSGPGSPPMMNSIIEVGLRFNESFGVWAVNGIVLALNKRFNIKWGERNG
jgi:hypothetical protein